jgi:HlyD family secretion protein
MSTPLVISVAVIVVAAALGVVLLQNQGQGQSRLSSDLYTVTRGGFDITIPASGELVALQQIEVRNRLESRATIMEIIDEGKTVQAGDLLLRLNDEEVRNRIKDAEDAVNSAESAMIASEASLAIRRSAAASERDRAELNMRLALLARAAWIEGEDTARREQLKSALETAEINFRRLEARLENSIRLHEDEFISSDELERDRIAMIEAQARYQQARRDIDVYEKYTYEQQLALKVSDVEQAEAELERVQQRHEAELETARADVASKRHQLDSRRERLAAFLVAQAGAYERAIAQAPEQWWSLFFPIWRDGNEAGERR